MNREGKDGTETGNMGQRRNVLDKQGKYWTARRKILDREGKYRIKRENIRLRGELLNNKGKIGQREEIVDREEK